MFTVGDKFFLVILRARNFVCHIIEAGGEVTDFIFAFGSYYNVGTFFDSYENDMLNIIVPITSEYKVKVASE